MSLISYSFQIVAVKGWHMHRVMRAGTLQVLDSKLPQKWDAELT